MLGTFPGGSQTYTCECGKRWRVTKHKQIMRDRDYEDCTCGRRIISWNEAAFCSAEEIRPEAETEPKDNS